MLGLLLFAVTGAVAADNDYFDRRVFLLMLLLLQLLLSDEFY